MKPPYELKIDAYAHIISPKYGEDLHKVAPKMYDEQVVYSRPLLDLDSRFRIMD